MPPQFAPLRPVPAQRGRPSPQAGGRFLLSDGFEHHCQTIAISVTGVTLRAAVRVRVGEHAICYLERYGRVEGHVSRLLEDGFAVDFSAPAAKRERLAQQLALDGDPLSAWDPRGHERLEPARKRVVLRLADGRHIAAQIINLSRSGAALTCPVPLAAGDEVLVGRRAARVARVTQRLVAAAFLDEIAAAEFRPDIVL